MRVVILVASLILVVVFCWATDIVLAAESNKRVQVLNGSPYVHLQHGLYFGKTVETHDKRKYHAFLGIRYAVTPKRYEKSVPMTDFDMMTAPYLAQSIGSSCPQISDNDNGTTLLGKMDEDCLFYNIFIPAIEPDDKDGFPVMVFIHPGSFKSGNGAFFDCSSYFMLSQKVICVNFNYRLGVLGFLSAEGISNLGLYDMITFLNYLNTNLPAFSGNKRRICLVGIEAGAGAIKYLLLSKSTKGLFQSAIIHGGSMILSTFLPHETISPTMRQFSDELECPHRPSHLLVECLKTKRLKDIMKSQKIISEKYFDFSSPFLPTHEPCDRFGVCPDSLFAKHPALLLAERHYKRVPLLIGMNSADTLLNTNNNARRTVLLPPLQPEHELGMGAGKQQETFTRWLAGVLQQIPGFQYEHLGKSFLMEIQQLYFRESMRNYNSSGNGGARSIRAESLDKNLSHLLYDMFVFSLWKFVMTYAHDKPVYPYLITFPETGNNSVSDHYSRAFPDSVEFLTPSLPYDHQFSPGSDEEVFSSHLVHLFTTFAIHQKPVDVWRNKETWLPLSAAQLNGEKPLTWYALNKDVDIIEDPFSKRMKFWDRILKQKTQR